jgi:hypothetical protein
MKNQVLITIAIITVLTVFYMNVAKASTQTSVTLQSNGVVKLPSSTTATPTPTTTAIPTQTAIAIATATPTTTSAPTQTAAPTITPMPTATPTIKPTPNATPTTTPTPTATPTPTSRPTPTPTPTTTPTSTETPTPTATPTPTPTATPTPTVTYSYTMATSGSNYQILNPQNTVIETSPSSSTAFNWLLGTGGHAAAGNTIYIKTGAYTVDSTWNININNVTVTFQNGATLTATAHGTNVGDTNCNMMWIYANSVTVTGITLDGNGLNQYPAPNVKLPVSSNQNNGITYSGNNIIIQNATIHNIRDFGITAAFGQGGTNDLVTNSTIYDCGANALQSDPTSVANAFTNNIVYNCGDVGISTQGLSDIITGNIVYNCWGEACPMYGYQGTTDNPQGSAWGIGVETGRGTSTAYLIIANNTLSNNGIGIWTNGGNYILISGNTLTNCNLQNYGAAIDINPNAANIIIEYNTITTAPIGIHLEGAGCTSNTVYGNTINSCTTNFVNNGQGTITTAP